MKQDNMAKVSPEAEARIEKVNSILGKARDEIEKVGGLCMLRWIDALKNEEEFRKQTSTDDYVGSISISNIDNARAEVFMLLSGINSTQATLNMNNQTVLSLTVGAIYEAATNLLGQIMGKELPDLREGQMVGVMKEKEEDGGGPLVQ